MKDECGKVKNVKMELELEQYYDLLLELEKAKLAIETQK